MLAGCPLPWTLWRDQQPIGQVIDYGYETPWASGRLAAADAEAHRRLIQINELQAEIETWPDEDEARWQAALGHRGLADADFAACRWQLVSADGPSREIFDPRFDAEGFVTWRW